MFALRRPNRAHDVRFVREQRAAEEAAARLGLSPRQARLLFDTFCDIDTDETDSIVLREFHAYFDLTGGAFADRFFAAVDKDGNGELDFVEFLAGVWHLCTCDEDLLAREAFHVFDTAGWGLATKRQLESLVCALHETAELPGPLRRALDDLRPQPHGKVALQQWASAVEEHPAITRPAVALRDRVRKRTLGARAWWRLARRRRKQHGSRLDVDAILFAERRRKAEERRSSMNRLRGRVAAQEQAVAQRRAKAEAVEAAKRKEEEERREAAAGREKRRLQGKLEEEVWRLIALEGVVNRALAAARKRARAEGSGVNAEEVAYLTNKSARLSQRLRGREIRLDKHWQGQWEKLAQAQHARAAGKARDSLADAAVRHLLREEVRKTVRAQVAEDYVASLALEAVEEAAQLHKDVMRLRLREMRRRKEAAARGEPFGTEPLPRVDDPVDPEGVDHEPKPPWAVAAAKALAEEGDAGSPAEGRQRSAPAGSAEGIQSGPPPPYPSTSGHASTRAESAAESETTADAAASERGCDGGEEPPFQAGPEALLAGKLQPGVASLGVPRSLLDPARILRGAKPPPVPRLQIGGRPAPSLASVGAGGALSSLPPVAPPHIPRPDPRRSLPVAPPHIPRPVRSPLVAPPHIPRPGAGRRSSRGE